MEISQPTHFIEQYNPKEDWKKYSASAFTHTAPLPLEWLEDSLKRTADAETLHTVAIFKIKYKNQN